MKPITIPAVLYMSLRTGQLVERPLMAGWTSGDLQQWESEHAAFPRLPSGVASVEALVEEAIRGALEDAGDMLLESASYMDGVFEGASRKLLRENGDLVKGMVDECIDSFSKRHGVRS